MRIKFLLFFALVTGFTVVATADMKVGALLGFRQNDLTAENTGTNFKTTGGFQVGGILHYTLADILGLRTGLIYADKSMDGTVVPANVGIKIKATYLDVPLDLTVSLPLLNFYAFGGIKYGIKSGSSCESALGSCTANVASSNTMWNLGLGYALDLVFATIAAEFEYEQGINNILVDSAGTLKTKAYAGNILFLFGF